MTKLKKKTRNQYIKIVLDTLHNGNKQQFRDSYLSLHPSDQADIFQTLDNEVRERIYSYLEPHEFTDTFGNLAIQEQKFFFLEMDEGYASNMLNGLFTDDVVNFLSAINNQRAEEILQQMDTDKANKVKALLAYAHETAGSIMTKETIRILSTSKVSHVLDRLRDEASDAEIIYYLYVIDEENELTGVVSLRDLIIANPDTVIKDIMSSQIVTVQENMDQEEVGHIIKKYDLLAVPVVSNQNHLLGIVTVDDVLDILEEETTEDFGEISATKGATDINVSPFQAAKKRAPWIVVLMLFGLITGGVIDRFEETLESVVLLAAFIPMIMDSGGNVGTQSLAVSVRGLALGTVGRNSFWRMVKREISTGALMGLMCMVVITIIVYIVYGNGILGLIVGVSLLGTLTVSAVVGSVIPLIINKLRFDPAIASGPFITTLNDIIGLMIYFSIATYFIDHLS